MKNTKKERGTNMLPVRCMETYIKRRSRRRMAWVSLISMLSIVILSMFFVAPERLEVAKSLIETLFICLSTIVLGYLGIATYDDKNIMDQSNPNKK